MTDWLNFSINVDSVFVEQPLASPGSANHSPPTIALIVTFAARGRYPFISLLVSLLNTKSLVVHLFLSYP